MFDSQTPVNDSKYRYKNDPMCKNIRDYLNTNNISDGAFAKLLDEVIGKEKSVGRTTITNWKNGKFRPKEEMWNYIAQVLGISLAEFKSDDGYKKSKKTNDELEETKKQLENSRLENIKLSMGLSNKTSNVLNIFGDDKSIITVYNAKSKSNKEERRFIYQNRNKKENK